MDTTWGANNDMDALLEDLDFIADDGTTDASVYLDADELTYLLDDESDLLGKLSSGSNNECLGMDRGSINKLQN